MRETITRENWRTAVDEMALVEHPGMDAESRAQRRGVVEALLHSLVTTGLYDGPEAMLERLDGRLARARERGPRATWESGTAPRL